MVVLAIAHPARIMRALADTRPRRCISLGESRAASRTTASLGQRDVVRNLFCAFGVEGVSAGRAKVRAPLVIGSFDQRVILRGFETLRELAAMASWASVKGAIA